MKTCEWSTRFKMELTLWWKIWTLRAIIQGVSGEVAIRAGREIASVVPFCEWTWRLFVNNAKDRTRKNPPGPEHNQLTMFGKEAARLVPSPESELHSKWVHPSPNAQILTCSSLWMETWSDFEYSFALPIIRFDESHQTRWDTPSTVSDYSRFPNPMNC